MGRLITGFLIVLFVVVVNTVVAFITTSATGVGGVEEVGWTNCDQDDNFTSCENVGKTTFLAEVFDVSYTGIDGAPPFLNLLYVIIVGGLFTVGILLIVLAFVPTTAE